jgi:hypothetical protein
MSANPAAGSTAKAPPSPAKIAKKLATKIAKKLGEEAPGARIQIRQIIQVAGADAALALLRRTREVEAAGGMMLPDGSRRRTPGGVYFQLAYEDPALGEHRRQEVQKRKEKAAQRAARQEAARIPLLLVVEEVLREAAGVLRVGEIVERAGSRLPVHRDPLSEVANAMMYEIRALGEASRFQHDPGGGFSVRCRDKL